MFAVVGAVEMCITGRTMELWETAFTGCGKAPAFPCAVNRVIHDSIACYAHFHNVCLLVVGSEKKSPVCYYIQSHSNLFLSTT